MSPPGDPERPAGEIERPAAGHGANLPDELHVAARLLLHPHLARQLDVHFRRLAAANPYPARKAQVDVETRPAHERGTLRGLGEDGRTEFAGQSPHVVGRELDRLDLGRRRFSAHEDIRPAEVEAAGDGGVVDASRSD